MKKLFTLAMLLVLALTVNAQETYRKSWDFTKWSATTVANLASQTMVLYGLTARRHQTVRPTLFHKTTVIGRQVTQAEASY